MKKDRSAHDSKAGMVSIGHEQQSVISALSSIEISRLLKGLWSSSKGGGP